MRAAEFSVEQHWQAFREFCHWEKASGGPDPQIAMVHAMSQGIPEQEWVWRALCYIAPYNVPFGEMLWLSWKWPEVLESQNSLRLWLDDQFAAKLLVTRFERRCVRRGDWMHEYMIGAARFAERWGELRTRLDAVAAAEGHRAAYELAWTEALKVPRLGRYVAIKFLELLRRHGVPIAEPDIRPKDAWSPRETLALLWQDHDLEARDNGPTALDRVRRRSVETIAELTRRGTTISLFELQVLLCEYRESWEGRKQYPGRSLDSELAYGHKRDALWKNTLGESQMWAVRRELFPEQHLGEVQGWAEPRKDVAVVLATHGYTWSDQVYSYDQSRENMAAPVPHEHGATTRLVLA